MKYTYLAPMLIAGVLLSGCAGKGPSLKDLQSAAETVLGDSAGSGVLSIDDISNGLREALSVGSQQVVTQLGQKDGFNGDPLIRIPLPTALTKARDIASKVGLSSSFDKLETRLNRAAEVATPRAKEMFLSSIRQMTLDDARSILQGPDDAATQYFRRTTGNQLAQAMRPIVDNSLSQVGAVSAFNELLAAYKQIPLAPKVSADLTGHVVAEGMDGIFHYIAQEEKAIRDNPLKRTSEILQRVFGSVAR